MVCRTTRKVCHVRLRDGLRCLKACLDAMLLVYFLETARSLADTLKAVDMLVRPKTLRSGARRCNVG